MYFVLKPPEMPGARYISPVRLSHAESAYSTRDPCPRVDQYSQYQPDLSTSHQFREVRGHPQVI